MSSDELDLENRVLCVDGTCIGVIGPDGRCKECGKPYKKELAEENNIEEQELEDNQELDLENRVLCVDGTCIGVIGPDGRCKECGKPYKD
jgi:hypothetical protein